MLIDGYNCVMFSDEDEFFEKAIYYLENESERMVIVNRAYDYFTSKQTWEIRAKEITEIVGKYVWPFW